MTLLDVGETFGEALRKIWNLSRVHPYLVKFHRFHFRFGHSEKGFQISDNNDLVMEKYVANPMPIRNPLSSLSMTTHPHPPIPSIIHIVITSLQFQDAHCWQIRYSHERCQRRPGVWQDWSRLLCQVPLVICLPDDLTISQYNHDLALWNGQKSNFCWIENLALIPHLGPGNETSHVETHDSASDSPFLGVCRIKCLKLWHKTAGTWPGLIFSFGNRTNQCEEHHSSSNLDFVDFFNCRLDSILNYVESWTHKYLLCMNF